MGRVKRQDLKGATKRGLIDKDTAQRFMGDRHMRTCPACGELFMPRIPGHKGFCCPCCAYAWGELTDNDKSLRTLATGVEVVVYDTGQVGTIVRILDKEHLDVKVGDASPVMLAPNAIERIQYLHITHNGCAKGKSARREQNERLAAPHEEEPPEDETSDN